MLMTLLASAVAAGLLLLAAHGRGAGARGLRSVVEALVEFIWRDIVNPALGERGRGFMPYFLTLFVFILLLNLLGLVPWGASATGNISVTAALSLLTLLLIHLSGIREHGLVHHVKNLVPQGVPMVIAPLVFGLELVGYVTKTLALCVRLFANMTAGHLVILLFLGLILLAGQASPITGLVMSPVLVALTLGLYLLELIVAFVQAYVFTMLTAIFVGGAVHPEH
jgi:F-type H+-transporting ATPase subunit a